MERSSAVAARIGTKWENSFVQVNLDNVGSCQRQFVSVRTDPCRCRCACVWNDSSHGVPNLKKKISTSKRISGRSPERGACGWLDRSFNNKLPRSSVISQQALWKLTGGRKTWVPALPLLLPTFLSWFDACYLCSHKDWMLMWFDRDTASGICHM